MASDDLDAGYTSSTTVHRRYWRRTDSPAAWWPWGLLPLLGLFLLFLWGALRTAPHIESDVEAQVTKALNDAGIEVSSVEADGQDVAVGIASSPVDAQYVRAVAQSAVCDTWRGQLDCPLNVSLSMTEPERVAPPPAPEPEPAPEPVVVAEPRFHDLVFTGANRAVRLQGEVASTDDRIRIVNVAKTLFEQIDDQLRVTGDMSTDQQPLAADRALAILARFEQGEATWRNGELNARGRVPGEADVSPTRDAFFAEANRPPLGDISIQVAEVVNRCNENLAATLNESTIRFRTSSAQIDAGNDTLLDSLAELIEACPGTLTIEGHTDSIGDDEMNLALSQARADAVRTALVALGVPSDRLNTRGFGETQPIGDNSTRAGRAQNRRIVISIDDL